MRILAGSFLVAGVVGAGAVAPSAEAAPSTRSPPAPVQPSPPPAPPKRKAPTEAYPAEAIAPFVEAVLADKAGDLDTASRRYQDVNRLSPQANTYYNIADLQRRMERWKQALESYRKYLELAPNAPDRAEVERLIAQLETRPGTAVIDGDEPEAIVFVDGKLVGPSPVVLQLSEGRHHTDRITPTTHVQRSFNIQTARTEHVRATGGREQPGNVILTGNLPFVGSWSDQGHNFRIPGRIALPPGRYSTYLVSRERACSPLVFDAPRADELVYVYVEAGEREDGRCLPIQIRQTKVRFAP